MALPCSPAEIASIIGNLFEVVREMLVNEICASNADNKLEP